jgi:hypothetical protein
VLATKSFPAYLSVFVVAGFLTHRQYIGRQPFGETYTAADLWLEMVFAAFLPSLSAAAVVAVFPSARRFNWKQGVLVLVMAMIGIFATWLIWSANQACWLEECD